MRRVQDLPLAVLASASAAAAAAPPLTRRTVASLPSPPRHAAWSAFWYVALRHIKVFRDVVGADRAQKRREAEARAAAKAALPPRKPLAGHTLRRPSVTASVLGTDVVGTG